MTAFCFVSFASTALVSLLRSKEIADGEADAVFCLGSTVLICSVNKELTKGGGKTWAHLYRQVMPAVQNNHKYLGLLACKAEELLEQGWLSFYRPVSSRLVAVKLSFSCYLGSFGLVQGSSVHVACRRCRHEAHDRWHLYCFLATSSWFTGEVVKWSTFPLLHAHAACLTLGIALVLTDVANVPALVLTQVCTLQGNVTGLVVALHRAEAVWITCLCMGFIFWAAWSQEIVVSARNLVRVSRREQWRDR